MTVSDTNSCRAQLSTIRPGQWRIWKAGRQTGRSATTSRERRHMLAGAATYGRAYRGTAKRPASPKRRCRLRAEIRLHSGSWESRPRRGVKLDAIASAHDHIAMYKRIGMDLSTKVAIQ